MVSSSDTLSKGETRSYQVQMRTVIYGLFIRDYRAIMRNPGQWCYPLSFFVWVVALFPLAIGPKVELLREMAAGSIWIAALLASYLSYPRIFLQDFESGVLNQVFFSEVPLSVHVQAKILSHWVFHGLPTVMLAPLLCLWMGLEFQYVGGLILSLVLGTLAIYTLNALMAALTLQANAGGALVMLLAMPLQVPIIVFGTSIVSVGHVGGDMMASLALLAALTGFLFFILPFMIGAILNMMVSG